MKIKVYKPAFILIALLIAARPGFAQDSTVMSDKQEAVVDSKDAKKCIKLVKLNLKTSIKHLEIAMTGLNRNINDGIRNLNELVGPEISNISSDINVRFNDNTMDAMTRGDVCERLKNY